MNSTENWVAEETPKSIKIKTAKLLDAVKEKRSKYHYKLVKVCDAPLTIKEVLIKK